MNKRRVYNKKSKKNTFFIMSMIVAAFLMISLGAIVVKANEVSGSNNHMSKQYTSICIEKNETLWDLANRYAPSNMSTTNYIKEIKKINKLNSNNITEGNYLIIPHYSAIIDDTVIND